MVLEMKHVTLGVLRSSNLVKVIKKVRSLRDKSQQELGGPTKILTLRLKFKDVNTVTEVENQNINPETCINMDASALLMVLQQIFEKLIRTLTQPLL